MLLNILRTLKGVKVNAGVSDLNGLSTEIRTFYSLKEIRESVEGEIGQFELLLEDYSQWLGTLLRNPESSKSQEWVKKAAGLQKVLKAGGRKTGSKKREKKNGSSTKWVQFKDLMLCADSFGEAEILFDAVEELRGKIDRLKKVKNSINDLERYGLGKEVRYITYIIDGVPERIVLKPREGLEVAEKFKFIADFSTTNQP